VDRVNVIGSSGSGKTTVGEKLARKLGVPFVEIDEIHWSRYPNWREPPADEFRAAVDAATRGDRWVVDGSYGKVRDIVWSRADTVVWLDTPFPGRFARMLRRTIKRRGTMLWGTQKETIRNTFFARDSLLLFMLRTERRRGRLYREWLARPEYAHLQVIRLRTQDEIDRWLARI
jgi:adenylate kinase family enzyme